MAKQYGHPLRDKLVEYLESVDGMQLAIVHEALVNKGKEILANEAEVRQMYEHGIISADYILNAQKHMVRFLEEGD